MRLRHLIETGISSNRAVRLGTDEDGVERWVVECYLKKVKT